MCGILGVFNTNSSNKLEKTFEESLDLLRYISDEIENKTFHHHYHILYDLINSYESDYKLNYLEIGCFAGGSACLVLQRPNTNVVSIDLGKPIPSSVVVKNVEKLNIHKNQYLYVKSNSHDIKTAERVKEYLGEVDVLFIDGDHSLGGVKKDFEIYSKFVKLGGYVVFDDYYDAKHSPGVRIFVDKHLKRKDYEIIGTLSNELGARPKERKYGNCFIIRKNG